MERQPSAASAAAPATGRGFSSPRPWVREYAPPAAAAADADEFVGNCWQFNPAAPGRVPGRVTPHHPSAAHPPAYPREAQGELVFDANFESGNLGRVAHRGGHEYDLHIRPDTCNVKQRIWFYFSVRNASAGQRALFNVVNYSKGKSQLTAGMTPVVRRGSGPWVRVPKEDLLYYRCPVRATGCIITFSFTFEGPAAAVTEFAYCYPYPLSQIMRHTAAIARRSLRWCSVEQVGETAEGRPLELITIRDPGLQGTADAPVPTCFVTARVHPGETPASFMAQGLIDFLISDHPDAQALRSRVVFKIIPCINPDGVYHGNYRCSATGFDLNRCYLEPKERLHPTVCRVKALLAELTADPFHDLSFYLDLHAHSSSSNLFLYGNWHEDPDRMAAQWVFPRLLAAHSDDFSLANTDFNAHKAKAATGRRSLASVLAPHAQIYTLEVSFWCYITKNGGAEGRILPYSEDRYAQIGTALGSAFADYFI